AIRLVDAEEADDRRRRLGHQEADPVPRLAPGLFQESSELIRPLLQPRIGQPLVVPDDRHPRLPLRLERHPLLEKFWHLASLRTCAKAIPTCLSSSRSGGTSRMNVR